MQTIYALLDHKDSAPKGTDEEMKTSEAQPVEEAFKRTLKALWDNLFCNPAESTVYDSNQFEIIEKLKH